MCAGAVLRVAASGELTFTVFDPLPDSEDICSGILQVGTDGYDSDADLVEQFAGEAISRANSTSQPGAPTTVGMDEVARRPPPELDEMGFMKYTEPTPAALHEPPELASSGTCSPLTQSDAEHDLDVTATGRMDSRNSNEEAENMRTKYTSAAQVQAALRMDSLIISDDLDRAVGKAADELRRQRAASHDNLMVLDREEA